MIVKVRKSRMYLAKSQMRQTLDDFFRASPVNLRLGIDILYPNPRTGNKRSRLSVAVGTKLDMRATV